MQQPSSVLGEAARCSSPTNMYSSSVKDDGIRVGAYAAGQEDLGSVVVLGRTRGAGKDSSVEGAGAGHGLGDHELQPAGVEAKEGMSTCDEFHSSLDELRRVTTTSFAPSWDQVPQPEDDSSIRELLRHWDSIMLHITGEGETEENEDALLCGHGAGSLNSSLNSLPGSSVLVDEPLTWEQSMFYEKKRFMDYTSCLTPEETKEMYEQGRMPELCCSSKEDEVGLISGTAVALAVAHGGPSSVLISVGAPALFPDQTAADAVLAIYKGAAPEMNLVGTETVLENLDQRTDQVRCRYAGTEKADRSPNTQPTEIMSTFGEGEGCGQPGSKHESAQVKDTRPMSQGRGISHKPGRKSNRRLPSAEAGVRGAVRDGQTNNTNHEVKKEVASEDDYNGSAPLRALKRRCRSRVEGVAEDVKCKRTLWNTDQAGGGAGRGKALKKEPQSSMKATGTTESEWRPRNGTRLRRTSSRGQNSRIEPRCEMNRAQSIPEDTKCKAKRRKTVRSPEVEHSPATSERVAVDPVILLHDADTESTLLTGAPTSRAGALETRFWRPKVWPPDDMRLDVGGAAVGPTFSNSAEFRQTGSTGSNVGTFPSSKEGPTSHQSQVSEPSQVPLVSQKLLSILSSPEFIIAGHAGVRCTYSDVVSSERVSVPAYSVAREDAKFDHGICLLTAGSMEMAPHSKEGSCLVGVMKDPVTEPHRDIEQEGQGLGRSQEQRGSMNCSRSTVCSQLWQGLCNQGARLAPCSTGKEVPMKLSVPNSTVTVSHIPPDLSRKNLPASMEPAAQETSPREMRPLLAAPKGGSGLDRDLSLVLQESIRSPCSQKGDGSPLSHTMSNQDLENVPATQAALGMSPQQVPESDDTVTDLVISNSSSRALGNSKECPTELNERLQSHDSSECAKESEGCGSDLGKAGRTRGDGASESQLLLLTSSHFSFVQARYAIHQGLQSEQDFDGIRIIHLLMGCVEALCSGDEGIGLAGVMLTRLTEMVDVRGYPLQRVAAHFVTGLKLAFGIDMENVGQPTLTRDAKAHLGRAYQVLHEVLPYIKFAHFTANHALLEAFEGKQEMHIVDYDIMDGMQWPPLMHALAAARDQYQEDVEESRSKGENKHTTAVTPTKLKITAVCRGQLPRNSIATSVTETGRRLEAFAKSLDLQFEFQAVQEPHVRIEEESLHHIALQGAWQRLFKDLVLHEKTSSTEIGGNNPREQGREDAPQGKVPPEEGTCGSDHQLLRKLVCADSTTKNVRSSTAQGSCPEKEKRVEAGKLKDDSSTDSLHQRHWSTHDYEQEGQVQHIQEQTSSPSEPMSSKRAGSARDGEWKRGRGRIRKLAGASGGHRSNQDEDTLCSENVRTKRNILPLKLLEAEIHDPTSHRASLHEKETPTRKESGQPARATKTGRHASYKRNKRLQTLMGHHTGKDPLSASRSTAGPADYAQRPEELASRNSSDSLVTLAGDSLISTKCRQDTGAKAGREEQVSVTDSDLEDVRIKGKPSINQFLNHLNQTKQRQCAKEEELQTGSQAREENRRPLQGGRRSMDERKTAFPNWINLAAEGADRGLQNDHDVKGNGTNRRKVQYYSRRKRPMDKKRTCPTTEVSGSSHKPVKDCPADAATKGTTTRAEDDLPLAARQEKTPGKAQKPQSSSTHDQTKVNEGITRKKADYEESVSAQKRSTSSSPDVNRGVAVNCMVHLPHMAHRETESVYSFLAAAARFSPHILTVGEDGMSVPGSENFLNYFCQGLYHFCALSDSLEESLPGKNLATAVVEQVFCAPRIASMLQSGRAHMEQQRPEDEQDAADPRRTKWSSFAPTLGFHSLPLSAANKYQGKLLLQLFPKGYEVLEGEQGDPDHRLMLAWKRRPIVAVSAWRS